MPGTKIIHYVIKPTFIISYKVVSPRRLLETGPRVPVALLQSANHTQSKLCIKNIPASDTLSSRRSALTCKWSLCWRSFVAVPVIWIQDINNNGQENWFFSYTIFLLFENKMVRAVLSKNIRLTFLRLVFLLADHILGAVPYPIPRTISGLMRFPLHSSRVYRFLKILRMHYYLDKTRN